MGTLAFLENINGPEMILIFLVVLLLFGAERLPGLFQSFGKSVREFKRATKGIEDDIRSAMDVEPVNAAPPPAKPASSKLARPAAKADPTVSAPAPARTSTSGEVSSTEFPDKATEGGSAPEIQKEQ
jgi:sec-independent protein translocase protein TatA